MAQIFKNNIFGVLQSGISNSATSMTLTDASSFPAPTGGDHYLVTLVGFGSNGSENAWEIAKVTAKASNTLTVVRAQEGTTAVSWPGATQVQMRLTAGSLDTKVDKISGKGLSTEDYSTAEKSKLAAVAAGATANATNAELRDRATHTGEQAISTVTGLQSALDGKEAAGAAASAVSAHTAAGDPHPQYTTAAEAASAAPVQSVAGRVGAVVLTKADVGLGNADNTSDATKAVLSATKLAAARTIAGSSFDGQTNIDISYTALTNKPALGTAAAKDVPATGNASNAQVVIGGDTRLSDARTPTAHSHAISDVTGLQTALDGKQPLDADLTAIAALTGATGLLKKTALDTWVLDTASYSTLTLGPSAGAALAASGSAGTATTAAKSDHVHPFPTAANVGAEPAITKDIGFAKWNGSAWSFDNSTYLTSAAIGSTVQAYAANLTSWAALAPSSKVDATGGTASGLTLNDGYTEEVFAVTGTAPALSPTSGSIQTWTLTGNSTPTAGTWASGQSMTLMVDDGSAYTINWASMSITWKTGGGTAPTLLTSGYTVIELAKVGSTIYGWLAGDA